MDGGALWRQLSLTIWRYLSQYPAYHANVVCAYASGGSAI